MLSSHANLSALPFFIASEAAPELNRLVTGKLTSSDIENVERYKASSLTMGAGIGANLGQDRKGDINTDGSGNPLSGIATPIGTVSATTPVALGASGGQSGITHSAIAPASIVISSGDSKSQQAADTISRDTANANGALEKEFTAEKREEIQQGFTAAKQLVVEVSTYFANRAAEQKAKEDEAEAAQKERDKYPPDSVEYRYYEQKRQDAATKAKTIQDSYGAGSPIRLIATALTGAAGGNVTGSVGNLVQSAAVNVLQGLAVQEIKTLVDGIKGDDATRETVRGALQAVVGCAGQAAGSGNCGPAAIGAAASVVLVNLLTGKNRPTDKDFDGIVDSPSLEEQQALTNIITTLIAGTAGAAGIDVPAAVLAAQIEIENNSNCAVVDCQRTVAQILRGDGMTLKEMEVKDPQAYRKIIDSFGTPERAEAYLVGRDKLAVLADKQEKQTITPEEKALYQTTLEQAGGNFETAQNILGLQHYYATQGMSISPTSNPTFDNANIADIARFYASFGKGTAKGAIDEVVESAKDIAGVLSDPQKAWEDTKEAAAFIWKNPEKFIAMLGAEGQKYVDDVKTASILYEAALLSGDANAQSKAAEQLGNLVGAPLALAVGSAGLGTAVKALKIGDKIIELVPGKKVPEITVFKIEASKATKGTPEFELLNNPPPNARIELDNGNIYVTNAHGFVDEVTFHPKLVKEARDSRQTEVGKQGLDTDVGGHIQACSLGGTCDKVNLFPQDAKFNNKEYKSFESEIRRALEAGEDVGPVKVTFKRSNPNDVRPTELSVEYFVGGIKKKKLFRNENGGGV